MRLNISGNNRRNIFDQYNQPENRLTHALSSCLNNDRSLLRKFVRWVTEAKPPQRLEILEQRLPGEEERSLTKKMPNAVGYQMLALRLVGR